MAVAVFDSVKFLARYPEFEAIAVITLQAFFDEAGLYLSNTDSSPVLNVDRRLLLLNMLTAHIAALSGAIDQSGAAPVGKVASATEGSVSVSFDAIYAPGTAGWYSQTQYGAAFWQATTQYRRFIYVPNPTIY
jgi:hypothetical protein